VGAADILRRPLADKFLHVAKVPSNANQYTKFQPPSSSRFGDMEGVQNKNRELLISRDAPYRINFYVEP